MKRWPVDIEESATEKATKKKKQGSTPPGTRINVQGASYSSKKDIYPQTYDSAGIDASHIHHDLEEGLAFCVQPRGGH